jgi:hypothetical protein
MDVRGREIAETDFEERASGYSPFLPGKDHEFPDKVAACGTDALPAGALCDAGFVRATPGPGSQKQGTKKGLDFRIYFATIRSALADYPRTPVNKTQRSRPLRLVILGSENQPLATDKHG